ncbi:kinase-like domain-containing protein [Gorgonomyces haynaldii]|nr:kinase-like domain-containing protein [Gorgonomyces haynaldii]
MDVAFSTTNGIEGYPKVENCAWTKITAEQLSALTAIKIGEGSFSVVYKATYQGKAVALKVSRRPLQTKQEFDAIKSEIDLWKSLSDHDNVVELHGACLSTMHPYVVMPYYEKGSIATYLRKNPDVPMVSRVKWMLDIAKGLTHLHQNDIRCGDLRLDNVMLTDKLFAVISDFGLTAFKKNGRTSNVWTSSRVMSEAYRCIAPEKNDHKLLNSKTYDIFCYGMTCYHLITGSTPFQIESNLDILRGMIIEGRFPMKPENSQIPEQIWANFQSCFTTDLDRRPTAADLSNGFDGFLRWHSLHPQPAAAPNRF